MGGKYNKSKSTDQDIKNITKQSILDFGEQQTDKYLQGLEESLELLADNPKLGRVFSLAKIDFCYYRYVSHVIYYQHRKQDVFIVRILHKKMLPEIHL